MADGLRIDRCAMKLNCTFLFLPVSYDWRPKNERYLAGYNRGPPFLFSDIFIPAKGRNNSSFPKKCLWCKHFASFIYAGNCIQLRHVAGALDLDVLVGALDCAVTNTHCVGCFKSGRSDE